MVDIIWDPTWGHSKEKRPTNPLKVVLNTCDNFLEGILETYGEVILAVDIMYKIPCMITTSKAIYDKMIKNKKKAIIIKYIQQIINIYQVRGFQIKLILRDSLFELQGIITNVTGRDEHVPEVERYIRT